MTVCHCSLPVAKAFCFLEDLRWEFTACFNNAAIALADRPYLFLEFGKQEEMICFCFISTVYVICFFSALKTHDTSFNCLILRSIGRWDHSKAEAAVQQERWSCPGGDTDRSPE